MTFNIRITEILEKTVKVEANSEYEAILKAHTNYNAAKDGYVLDAENITNVDFKVVTDDK
jgi:hypothetical protein